MDPKPGGPKHVDMVYPDPEYCWFLSNPNDKLNNNVASVKLERVKIILEDLVCENREIYYLA